MSSPEILEIILRIREAIERFVKELERIVMPPPVVPPKPKIEIKIPPVVVPIREVPTEAPVEIVPPAVIPPELLPKLFRELTVEELEKVLRTVIKSELEAALGRIYYYYRGKKIGDLHQGILPGADARVLINLQLKAGDELSATATDLSGATNKTDILLVIDKKPAT